MSILVTDASAPASRFPNDGAAATCMNSIPETRPSISFGVIR